MQYVSRMFYLTVQTNWYSSLQSGPEAAWQSHTGNLIISMRSQYLHLIQLLKILCTMGCGNFKLLLLEICLKNSFVICEKIFFKDTWNFDKFVPSFDVSAGVSLASTSFHIGQFSVHALKTCLKIKFHECSILPCIYSWT